MLEYIPAMKLHSFLFSSHILVLHLFSCVEIIVLTIKRNFFYQTKLFRVTQNICYLRKILRMKQDKGFMCVERYKDTNSIQAKGIST